MDINDIATLIKKELGWKLLSATPKFLKKYRWKPKFIFFEQGTKNYIAVDLIFNQQLSKKIYEKEVLPALSENKNLKVCLLSPSEHEHSSLKRFCKKERIGLKIYSTYDINTIVPLSFEKVGKVIARRIKKEGWFPRVILDEVKKIKKVSFADLLKDLANKLAKNTSKDKQFSLIRKYINKILQSHSDFIGDTYPFMKLSNFESLLKLSNINNREHVFHSVRVFIIGCIIIDRFYDDFMCYYKEIFPGTKKINLEYMWLMTSLFHDIGRIKQKAYLIYMHNEKEENETLMEVLDEQMSKAWKDREYYLALGNVVELINHCCMKKEDRQPFTGFAIEGKIDPRLSGILTESYNKRISHGVISCFDLAADLLRKIGASKKTRNKTFLLYHIFPAIVAIALHDWRIWEELKPLKVFPMGLEKFPLAALLIYIDTWDDFKRDEEVKMSIDKIEFNQNQVTIYITWYKKRDYLEEKAKYKSFEKNICFSKIKFKIKISNEE